MQERKFVQKVFDRNRTNKLILIFQLLGSLGDFFYNRGRKCIFDNNVMLLVRSLAFYVLCIKGTFVCAGTCLHVWVGGCLGVCDQL